MRIFKNNLRQKILCFFAAVSIMCIFCAALSFAEVYTEKSGGGKVDSVFVAGNPDMYPIEYYDSDSETYEGLFPELLEEISDKTGIGFTYISSGKTNKQRRLYKNKQVDMLTAISSDSNGFDDAEGISVLTAETGGKEITYSLVFTDSIGEDTKNKIIDCVNSITQSQKNGIMIKNAEEDLLSSKKQLLIIFAAVLFLLLTAAFAIGFYILSKRKKSEKLDRMVDKNTGIGNLDYYEYVFENLISEQSKNLYSLAYASFDASEFEDLKTGVSIKNIEQYAASRLNGLAQAGEYVAYIDKGIFLFLFRAENAGAAEERVSDILGSLNKYISQLVKNCDSLFRIGYCRLCENVGANAENVLYNARQGYIYAETADLAYKVGSKALAEETKKAEALATHADSALKGDEFKIYMQLIADAKGGSFCGAEVLSRWQNSEYGLLRPHEYINILNKTGKIVEHDYCIFEKACQRLEKWSKPPFDKLFLTCNFTRISFSKSDFIEKIKEIKQKYNFSPERIVIEITEDTLCINSKIVSDNIKRLSSLGFKVAIDDMGAGFSSLADIYDNEIDIVKIERDFLTSCDSERRRQMLRDIISLVHNAGAAVICEGIETSEQLEMLKTLGCDMMQGFYCSRVLPFSEGEKLVISHDDKQ